MTVFQSIQIYESKYKFKFNSRGKNNVGLLVKQRWRKQHPGQDVPLVSSFEPDGTFNVADYPDHFTDQLHAIVKEYVKFIIEKPRKAKAKAKSAPNSISSTSNHTTMPKKERKRKPLQKPAFSGKLLNKRPNKSEAP